MNHGSNVDFDPPDAVMTVEILDTHPMRTPLRSSVPSALTSGLVVGVIATLLVVAPTIGPPADAADRPHPVDEQVSELERGRRADMARLQALAGHWAARDDRRQ
jgi:hypothetical protein